MKVRQDVKDIVQITDEAFIGQPFRFIYTSATNTKKLVASWDGKSIMTNCRWGNDEHTIIIVPIDMQDVPQARPLKVTRSWRLPDPDFRDGYSDFEIEEELAEPDIKDGTIVSTLVANMTKGEDGKDGKSAYEIWLQNGNDGSEQDFLAAISCGITVDENGILHANGKAYKLTPVEDAPVEEPEPIPEPTPIPEPEQPSDEDEQPSEGDGDE